MTYRVHFPGLTQDLTRDFTDKQEATEFYNHRRNADVHMWRHVWIEEVEA